MDEGNITFQMGTNIEEDSKIMQNMDRDASIFGEKEATSLGMGPLRGMSIRMEVAMLKKEEEGISKYDIYSGDEEL